MEALTPYSEIIGNTAGIIVLISLLMRSLIRLRWINLLGALIFCVYGTIVEAHAIVLTNLGISGIDLYFLYKLYSQKKDFTIVEAELDSAYCNHYLMNNQMDMKSIFGDFAILPEDSIYYMLRNNSVAGILIGQKKVDTFEIKIDYVTPEYRDFRLGKYFFQENTEFFQKNGIKNLIAKPTTKTHNQYLEKIGFTYSHSDNNEFYKKEL
ncbi:MAG: hypothetical protein JJT78_12810 [Leptospira sp.]|nr:hypothetical protein [Leptospira sp.]